MAQLTAAESRPLSTREIKEFGVSSGPCVTIYIPVEVPGGVKKQLSLRLKAAAGQAERRLGELSLVSTLIRKIVDPIADLADRVEDEAQGATLVVFRSEEELRYYWLRDALEETIVAADNFYIRPLLKDLGGERQFYLLALDQKNLRLLRCTEHSSEEIELEGRVPTSLLEVTQTDQPDHVLKNRSSAGPSSAGSKGITFGTTADSEAHDEYLLHYYRAVNDAIRNLLKGQEKTPLVVCGVEYELALFERVNTWANVCKIRGAANGLKGGEMHSRALECLDRMSEAEVEQVIAQHDRQGGEVATAGVNDLLKAAYEGRILHLFAAENAQAMGNFDEAAHRARTHQVPRIGDEDLLNAAAIQTILHGGRVHVIPQARVPGNRPMAAIMRY